jgi:hypothetical protein
MIPARPSTLDAGPVDVADAGISPLIESLATVPTVAEAQGSELPAVRLPPGLHAAFVDSRDARDDSLRVTLLDGRRSRARLAPHVQRALLDQCLAHRLMVLLSDGDVPVVVGALQTAPLPFVDRDGTLTIEARRLRLRAHEELRLEAGANTVLIEMDDEGRVKLRCERAVFDVASNLRIYSALVELP